MFRIAYVVTHPIQYQAPLLRYLCNSQELRVKTFFLSDFSFHEHYEDDFRQQFQWDVPLTSGYEWEVLPKYFDRFFSRSSALLPVRNLFARFNSGGFDCVWIHGWGQVGLVQAVKAARSARLPILLRGESTLGEVRGRQLRSRVGATLRQWLFRQASGFLYIGSENRAFYRQAGVPDERLFPVPYAVDNEFFQERARDAHRSREAYRQSLGLKPERPIVLFAAKFTKVKAPDELLHAFKIVWTETPEQGKPYLLFVGDGPLRPKLEDESNGFGGAIRFLGFRNQTELPALYDLCDVFVLPSRFEPWGLVVNEVMNAGKPIIVSDRVGAVADLVRDGVNGFVYSSGDPSRLAERLRLLLDSTELRNRMGIESSKRIETWNFEADRQGLLEALGAICSPPYSEKSELAL